ncbi:MAG: hypothetical protein CSA82_02430 [Actinobacteria bacterium]|nr:MAG: hypothetical protein CSA82_02430 [Actinomycetota bacterium]
MGADAQENEHTWTARLLKSCSIKGREVPFVMALLVIVVVFFGSTTAAFFADNDYALLAPLLLYMPVTAFVVDMVFTWRYGFTPWIILLVGVFTLMLVLVFYNESALVYIPIYMLITAIGSAFGAFIHYMFPGGAKG